MDDGPNLVRLLAFNGSLIVLIAIVVGFLIRRTKRIHDAAWRAFAEKRGFEFTPSRGFWTTWQTARVDGTRNGRPIAIESFFRRVGRGPALFTRITAGEKERVLDGFVMDAATLDEALERLIADEPHP